MFWKVIRRHVILAVGNWENGPNLDLMIYNGNVYVFVGKPVYMIQTKPNSGPVLYPVNIGLLFIIRIMMIRIMWTCSDACECLYS